MEYGYHLNFIRCDFIKYCEWKTPNDCASKISVDDRIKIRSTNDCRQSVVDTFHELQIQVFALLGVPLTGFGEFGVRVGSEPNDHVWLARFHEFGFDLVPGSTKRLALAGIVSSQLQPTIELSLLSIS